MANAQKEADDYQARKREEAARKTSSAAQPVQPSQQASAAGSAAAIAVAFRDFDPRTDVIVDPDTGQPPEVISSPPRWRGGSWRLKEGFSGSLDGPISKAGMALVKEFEGCYLNAYLCPAGVATIGYGHTRGVKLGDTITQEQADVMLREGLAQCREAVRRYVKPEIFAKMSENQIAALTSFTFNCGEGALKNSRLLRLINEGAPPEVIAAEFLRWNKATVNGEKVELRGLTRRREAEASLYMTPDDVQPKPGVAATEETKPDVKSTPVADAKGVKPGLTPPVPSPMGA